MPIIGELTGFAWIYCIYIFLTRFSQDLYIGMLITQSTLLQCDTLTLLHNVREDRCKDDEKDGKSVPSRKRENKTIYI